MKISLHPYLAEFLGTFGLVVSATSAGTLVSLGYSISPLGDGLFSGVAVLLMILLFGPASGAHINPAVSIAMVRAGKLSKSKLPGYLSAQFAGAVLASVVMRQIFAEAPSIGAHQPGSLGLIGSLWMEVLLTAILVGVIFWIIDQDWAKGPIPAVVIGLTVTVEVALAGSLSGASMNPARSFGPALVSGELASLWIYFVGPFAGGLVAVTLCRLLRPGPCCQTC